MDQQAIERPVNYARCDLLAEIASGETEAGIKKYLPRLGAALRVLAPATGQRTAFQEDDGANAGAVVGRVALNIENHNLPSCFICRLNYFRMKVILTRVNILAG